MGLAFWITFICGLIGLGFGVFIYKKIDKFYGAFIAVISIAVLCGSFFCQTKPCILTKIDTEQTQYTDYVEYTTYFYFEDKKGNLYKKVASDMGEDWRIGETYHIHTLFY